MSEAVTTTTKRRKSFLFHRNATFISLLVGYAGFYLCRQNISVAIAPMKVVLGLTPREFGWITSIGTMAYTVGKVLTGSAADSKFGGKTIFYIGLLGSVLFSIIFSLKTGVIFFIVIWALNRFFQSMGWGGLVNVMSRWFPVSQYGTAMGIMSINYQFGAVVASVYAGVLITLGFGWRGLFVMPALTLLVIGVVTWFFMSNSPKDVGHEIPVDIMPVDVAEESTATPETPHVEVETTASAEIGAEALSEDKLSYIQRFGVLLRDPMFLVMVGLSFVLTFLREVFNLWMPSYFSAMGSSASMAAFKSAVFPLLGCVGTLFAGWFSDRFLEGRRGPVMCVLMFGLVASLLALSKDTLIANVAHNHLSLWFTPQNTAVILVGLVGFFLLGPYSLVGGVVALDFGGRKTAGTAAGLLDGAGYLGATLSGIGIAEIIMRAGWNYVYGFMAVLTGVAILLSIFLWKVKPKS